MISNRVNITVITVTTTFVDMDISEYDFNRALLCVLGKNGMYKEGVHNPFFNYYLLLFWNLGHEFITFLNKNSLEVSIKLILDLYCSYTHDNKFVDIFSEFLNLLIYQNFLDYPD
jgi:hypothetical protein